MRLLVTRFVTPGVSILFLGVSGCAGEGEDKEWEKREKGCTIEGRTYS